MIISTIPTITQDIEPRAIYEVQVQENELHVSSLTEVDDAEFDEYWNSKDVFELVEDIQTGRTKLAKLCKHFKDDVIFTPPGSILRHIKDRSRIFQTMEDIDNATVLQAG
jgi:hypothetical protein